MSDSILSGRWKVYYEAENRQKRIWRDTAVTPTVTDTVNALYSALQDLFDELNQMDDGTPMSAQTPTAYTIGIVDAGDDDPWYIDQESTEYLTGGAISTASWNRVETSNTGIVRMGYAQTVALVASDIGKTIVMTTDGDSGTLLDYNSTTNELVIRPDTNAAANSFDNSPTADGAWTITGGTGTGTQSGGAATSGEWLYSNATSTGLTALQSNTTLGVFQDGSALTSYKNSTDWWGYGDIDILIPVKKDGTLIDEGFVTVVAKRPSTTHAYFITDLSAGGSNPIPLAAGNDLDDADGYRQMVLTDAAGGPFQVGEIIEDDTDSTKQGVVTSVSGSNPNVTLQYYLIGDPLTDFQSGDGQFTGQTSSATGTAVNPTNVNGALAAGISVTHANTGVDVTGDGTAERYSVTVDCSDELFPVVYKRLKYLTRRGETSTGDTDGIEGQQYLGIDYRIAYTTITGTVSEGAVVTQVSTGATGTVVAHHTAEDILTLRNSRGAFNNTNNIEVDGSNYVTGPTCVAITPVAASPFGTYPGSGTFFFAPGVVPTNVHADEVNNYSVTDDTGTVRVEPTQVSVTIGNTRLNDRIGVYRLTGAGGQIEKDRYNGTAQSLGATTLVVGTSITGDEPGKTSGGVLKLVDVSANVEYRLRYSSWSGSTFTLAHTDVTAEAGTDTDTIVDTGVFATTKVGDLVLNTSRSNAVSYVTEVTDNDTIQISPAISGQTTGDIIDMNPLPVATTTSDTVYVPIIETHETTGTDGSPGSEAINMVYLATVEVRVRARQGKVILPYEADAQITSGGLTNNVIRTNDTIAT